MNAHCDEISLEEVMRVARQVVLARLASIQSNPFTQEARLMPTTFCSHWNRGDCELAYINVAVDLVPEESTRIL